MASAGPRGGHYTWEQHLFPLTDFLPHAWLPRPLDGARLQILSGAGSASKVNRVGHTDYVLMAIAAPGSVRVDADDDPPLRLTVVAVNPVEHADPAREIV